MLEKNRFQLAQDGVEVVEGEQLYRLKLRYPAGFDLFDTVKSCVLNFPGIVPVKIFTNAMMGSSTSSLQR